MQPFGIRYSLCMSSMHNTPTLPEPPLSRRLHKPREVAELLGCSYSMALALIRRGDLPAVHVGRLPRVRDADLAAFLARGGTR